MKSSPSDLSDIKTGVDIGIQILSRDIMPALSDLITKLKNNEQFDFGQWLTKTGTALIATGASAVGAGVISIVNLIGESKRQGDVREARVRAEDLLGRYRQLYYMYAGLKPMTDFFYEKGLMVRNFYLKYILREPDALYTNIVNALYHGEMSDSGARDFIMNSAPAQELRAKGIPPDERDWFQLDGVDTSGVMNTGDMLPAIVAVGAGMIASLV